MQCETIDLYTYFSVERKGATGGYLKTYAFEPSKEMSKRYFPAMLIFPGGGYRFLSDREGEPVALQFMAAEYQSFVLRYSLDTPHPAPLIEAAMAAAYIRENAEKYFVRKDTPCRYACNDVRFRTREKRLKAKGRACPSRREYFVLCRDFYQRGRGTCRQRQRDHGRRSRACGAFVA